MLSVATMGRTKEWLGARLTTFSTNNGNKSKGLILLAVPLQP